MLFEGKIVPALKEMLMRSILNKPSLDTPILDNKAVQELDYLDPFQLELTPGRK